MAHGRARPPTDAVGRPPLPARLGGQPQPAGGRPPDAGVRHGDPGGRRGAGPLGVQPFGQLPLCHGLRRPRAARRPGREAGRPARPSATTWPPASGQYARSPSDKELAATTVLRLALDEASVKVSEGPPDDGDGPDGDLEVWAGEVPLRTVRLDPVADPALRAGIGLPHHIATGRRCGPGHARRGVELALTGSSPWAGASSVAAPLSRGTWPADRQSMPWASATGS